MSDQYTHLIEIYTSNLVIGGAYDLPIYRRVSDAINGEQRRYVPLRDGVIAPLERPQQPQRVPTLLFDREETLLVATLDEAAPPANYAREEQVRDVEPISVMFFTNAFVVRATMHKRPDLSLTDALERLTDEFLSLSNVHIFPLVSGFAPITRTFAALRRTRIVALYQVPTPAAEAAPTEEPIIAPVDLESAVAEDTTEPQP